MLRKLLSRTGTIKANHRDHTAEVELFALFSAILSELDEAEKVSLMKFFHVLISTVRRNQ